jgi:hypothetical protein
MNINNDDSMFTPGVRPAFVSQPPVNHLCLISASLDLTKAPILSQEMNTKWSHVRQREFKWFEL